ncbi:MAG: hypothetical protein GF372_03240, partial [Candidatus Marinimicrobia bacterium]|nr:hypothetical protein [Candidatus Neomarinimicrobiota bacterium]
GGYVGIYSADLSQRYGEAFYEEASAEEIWVQPPGTPTVGETFLRAYQITDEEKYLNYAKDAALALCWGQRQEGGWDHRVDVSHRTGAPSEISRHSGRCTFDDEITQGAIMFLMALDTVLNESWLNESIELGMAFMIESQFENGGWPQWYPLRGGYHDYYTFNDGAINDNIRLMMHAYRQYGNPEYLKSAEAGGEFIIQSQWKAPQSGWAQQYNHDLEPAWARRFEPPGICSLVTGRNIHTLIELYLLTDDDKYLEPIPAAIRWLENSQIGDEQWARLYEVGSNKPIYGDREDGNKIFYDYQAISERERTSYGWQGSYGIPGAIARYEHLKTHGSLDNYNSTGRSAVEDDLSEQVQYVTSNLNNDGFWLTERVTEDKETLSVITSATFVNNANVLLDYIQSQR